MVLVYLARLKGHRWEVDGALVDRGSPNLMRPVSFESLTRLIQYLSLCGRDEMYKNDDMAASVSKADLAKTILNFLSSAQIRD